MNAKAKTVFVVSYGQVVGVDYQFADGGSFTARLEQLNPTVRAQAAAMGIREALRDTYAGAANPAEARAMLEARWEAMVGESGEYARRGAGAGAISAEMLVEAILAAAEETGQVVDAGKVRVKVQGMDAKARTALTKKVPAVAVALAKIVASRNGGDKSQDLETMFD